MKKLIYIVTAFICLLAVEVQAQFSITGEVRPRSEFRNGFQGLRAEHPNPGFATSQRSRLYLDFKDEKVKMRLSFQDVRVWGNQPLTGTTGASTVADAWAQYNFTSKFGVKVGRQIISYDNQRFLGGLEWAQQGRRHDAAVFSYEDADSKLKIHAGFGFNQSGAGLSGTRYIVGANAQAGTYKSMQYLWANKAFEGGSVSALLFNEGHETIADTVSNKQTLGLVAKKAFGDFTIAGEGYYQTGDANTTTKISAYMFDLNATYKTSLTPITVGYQMLSGKDQGDKSTDVKAFAPSYGTNHAHNGFMDYFYVGNPHGGVGLQDIYLKTKFKVGKGALLVQAHQFLAASKLIGTEDGDLNKEMAPSLGTEIDLVYALKLSPVATLNVGYSQMFGTSSMKEAKRASNFDDKGNFTHFSYGDESTIQNWAWVMLTIKPKFFESK